MKEKRHPRLPRGRRLFPGLVPSCRNIFQSTPPSREATSCIATTEALSIFQSTPPSREATAFAGSGVSRNSSFQSTPPSREATMIALDMRQCCTLFQSTPPSREATHDPPPWQRSGRISIHASLAGGDPPLRALLFGIIISIHASLAGGDSSPACGCLSIVISIHASLAGGDSRRALL